MASYYNEIEPFAAEWLRQLIKGLIYLTPVLLRGPTAK